MSFETQIGETDATERLARFLTAMRDGDPGEPLLARASDLLLDHLAVCIQGMRLPWSKIVADYACAAGMQSGSVVYGYQYATAPLAALANGTIAHGIELDDTHDLSCSHPGAVVFSAALAVAQETGSTGREFLLAVIAGYEAMGRAGAALDPDLMVRGLHPTALCGAFGACAAAAALMKLDADALQSAWGIALSMASGAMQFTQDPQGTMVKRLHGGWPAHNGIIAAQLAARGLTGPRGSLDGLRGFINIFSPAPNPERLTEDLGSAWVVQNISIKRYACCRLFHAMVDAIHESRTMHGWGPEDLESIEVFGPRIMSDGHMQYRPESVMSAQYSLPFSVAVALVRDPSDPRSFELSTLQDEAILKVADKVTARVDGDLEKFFPKKFPGGMQVTLKDGRRVSHQLLDSVGTPERPIDRQGIEQKFRALTNASIGAGLQEKLIDAALGMESAQDVSPLAFLLSASSLKA